MNANKTLVTIKIIHTVVWVFFVSCILAIPFFSYTNNFFVSLILISLVAIEAFVIIFNRWSCPLTNIAAKYTDERADNFDIYLPLWLAKYNKMIFGSLFVLATVYTLVSWIALQ